MPFSLAEAPAAGAVQHIFDGFRQKDRDERASDDLMVDERRGPASLLGLETLAHILTLTDPMIYRLHYFPESGNSYKLALMLALCGVECELVWTDFGAGVTRTAAWRRAINPMGEIPVLEEDGEKSSQTAPILLRLADRYGRFQGANEAERFEVLRWLFWDNQRLSAFMASYRYMRAFMPSADPTIVKFFASRVNDYLGIAEVLLGDRPFVIGDQPTVADISMMAYLSFPPIESGYDLAQSHPAIDTWLKRMAGLPGWKAPYDLMPGKRLPCYV